MIATRGSGDRLAGALGAPGTPGAAGAAACTATARSAVVRVVPGRCEVPVIEVRATTV